MQAVPDRYRANAWMHHPHWYENPEELPDWLDRGSASDVELWNQFVAWFRWNKAIRSYKERNAKDRLT